jgi:glutaminyl-tRNA synthetase
MGVMNPIKLVITNWKGDTEWVEVENNPENESAGKRLIPFTGELFIEKEDFREEANSKFHRLKLGGEVRLKGAYIVKANEVIKNEYGEIIEIRCTYDPLTKSGISVERKVKGTIHWVSVKHGVKINVNEYDRLFIDKSPDKNDDDLINYINPESLVVNNSAVFEPLVLNTKNTVQMMRKGYYILDTDGKSFNKTVSLKERWVG